MALGLLFGLPTNVAVPVILVVIVLWLLHSTRVHAQLVFPSLSKLTRPEASEEEKILLEKQLSWRELVFSKCPSLQEVFKFPHSSHPIARVRRYLRTGAVQLAYSMLFLKKKKEEEEESWIEEKLRTEDGGTIALMWRERGKKHIPLAENDPILFIAPGLSGTCHSPYIQKLMAQIRTLESDSSNVNRHFRVVVLHYRGVNSLPLTSGRTYAATETADLELALEHIRLKKHPSSTSLYSIAFSFGSVLMTRFLADNPEQSLVNAYVGISTPFDYLKCANNLLSFWNKRVYNAFLTKDVRDIVRRNVDILRKEAPNVDVDGALVATTVQQFDAAVTCPQYGFETPEDYYQEATVSPLLPRIQIPVLYINAADDPFCPVDAIPKDVVRNQCPLSSRIAFLLLDCGSHISFLQQGDTSIADQVGMEFIHSIRQGNAL